MFVEDRGSTLHPPPRLPKRTSSRFRRSCAENPDTVLSGSSQRTRAGETCEAQDVALTSPSESSLEASLVGVANEMPPPYTAVEDASNRPTSAALPVDDTIPMDLPSPRRESMDAAHDAISTSSAELVEPDTFSPDTVRVKASRNNSAPFSARGPRRLASMVPSFLSRMSYVSAVEAKKVAEEKANSVEALEPLPPAFMVLLHSLRLFATVPGIIGTWFAFRRGMNEVHAHHWVRTTNDILRPGALEYFLCCAWSLSTAFHALSLMTLLLRRWLIYYAVLPSVIRLVAFQSICWSLVRFSLYLFGPQQPLGGWLLVSSFTASIDIVARWITSNITDLDEVDHEAHAASDYPDTGASDGEGLYSAGEGSAPLLLSLSTAMNRQRYSRYRKRSARLFRVLVGGPTDEEQELSESDTSDTDTKSERVSQNGELRRRRLLDPSAPTSDSDGSSSPYPTVDPAVWRQRVDARHSRARQSRTERSRRRRRAKQSHISSFFQNYRAARIHSRRVFHWEVAMWRNVMPIALLGYLTLWALLLAHYTQTSTSKSL